MSATATWPPRMGPREDSPSPAPVPEKLPPREPVVPAKLRSTLKRVFGLRTLRPGQAEVLEQVLVHVGHQRLRLAAAGEPQRFEWCTYHVETGEPMWVEVGWFASPARHSGRSNCGASGV